MLVNIKWHYRYKKTDTYKVPVFKKTNMLFKVLVFCFSWRRKKTMSNFFVDKINREISYNSIMSYLYYNTNGAVAEWLGEGRLWVSYASSNLASITRVIILVYSLLYNATI